jgi:phosphatidylserine/phosphatidylglycerophosphate/cardiolipin synthase-like enzyme
VRRLYIAPTDDCITPLIDTAKSARHALRVAFFTFNIDELTNAIIERYTMGVPVKCLFDASQTASFTAMSLQIQKLKTVGVPVVVGTSTKHKYMHLKLIVADNRIAFGSFNATKTSQLEANTLNVETSRSLSSLLVTEFDRVWDWNRTNPKVWYSDEKL